MNFPEPVFLRQSEYIAEKSNRHNENSMVPSDSLFSVMFSLDENMRGKEAATLPAQIAGRTALWGSGISEVNIVFLNPDLKPSIVRPAKFLNGIWVDVDKHINIVDATVNGCLAIKPLEAYVKDYNDGLDEFRVKEFATEEEIIRLD